MNISFQAENYGLQLGCAPFHHLFLNSSSPEFIFTVKAGNLQDFSSGITFFSTSQWSYKKYFEQGVILFLPGNWSPDNKNIAIVFQNDGNRADMIYEIPAKNSSDSMHVQIPQINLDELLTGHILGLHRGVMLHSCALKTNANAGLLFAGVSGAGKSTTAKLWQTAGEATLFGDERVVVRKQDGSFWMYSTAWHGKGLATPPGKTSLSHLFILDHAGSNHARRLKSAEAVSLLLPRTYLPFWDRPGLDFSLEFLEDICRNIPCYSLGFTPDQRAVDYVKWLIST